MKKLLLRIGLLLVVVLAVYNLWAVLNRAKEQQTGWRKVPEFKSRFELIESGVDSGKGNIIGIQPYLTPINYSTAFNFETSLRFYFEQLKREQKINAKTIVVLPEYIGSWLVAANEKEEIYQAKTMQDAMTTIVKSNLFSFLYHYWQAPAIDKTKYALFSLKSAQMAKQYQAVFSSLAKDYHCTIVAGSIVLPAATIDDKGQLIIQNKAELYNTSAVFGIDGKIIPPLVQKLFPIDSEKGFTAGGSTNQQPIFQTSAGRMAVLICADSWYPQAYQTIAGKSDFVVVPSLGAGTDSIWLAPWNGYNGAKAPADVDTNDYHKISEGDAWAKYSMGTRAVQNNIHQGLNVFFTGSLWDLQPEGRVLVLNQDSLSVLPAAKGHGRIVNYWLH